MTDVIAENGGEIGRARGLKRVYAGACLELNTATIRGIERLPVRAPGLAQDLIASQPFRPRVNLGKLTGSAWLWPKNWS